MGQAGQSAYMYIYLGQYVILLGRKPSHDELYDHYPRHDRMTRDRQVEHNHTDHGAGLPRGGCEGASMAGLDNSSSGIF